MSGFAITHLIYQPHFKKRVTQNNLLGEVTVSETEHHEQLTGRGVGHDLYNGNLFDQFNTQVEQQ